jgi:hypothetical protein
MYGVAQPIMLATAATTMVTWNSFFIMREKRTTTVPPITARRVAWHP